MKTSMHDTQSMQKQKQLSTLSTENEQSPPNKKTKITFPLANNITPNKPIAKSKDNSVVSPFANKITPIKAANHFNTNEQSPFPSPTKLFPMQHTTELSPITPQLTTLPITTKTKNFASCTTHKDNRLNSIPVPVDLNRHTAKLLHMRQYLQDKKTKQWHSDWWYHVLDEDDYRNIDKLVEHYQSKKKQVQKGMTIDVGEQCDCDNQCKQKDTDKHQNDKNSEENSEDDNDADYKHEDNRKPKSI